MRILVRVVLALVAIVLVLSGAAWFGGRAYLRRSVAQYEGTVRIRGLANEVEVLFDARGVPQLYAKSDADARFALGWLHASERLFQMELTRRMARGELSELFGPAAVELDTEQGRLGFAWKNARDMASMDTVLRRSLEEYVAGVNAWIAQAKPLPPEFVILGFKPRDWTVEDVSLVGFYQSWFALTLMDRGADYRDVFAKLGGDASRLAHAIQAWSPPAVPVNGGALRMTKASNSWVVAPAHSASGAALHASDPHLELSSAPGLWYAVGIHTGEGLDVVGVSAPGIPSISMGHNRDVSWAFTVAPVDLVDDYEYAKGAIDATLVTDTIRVKGEPARVVEFLRTPQGTLTAHGDSLRLRRWAGYDFPAWSVVAGADAIMRQRDFEGFRRAVTSAGALSVNWTYADRNGHIGYVLGSPLPVRDGFDTFVPQSGTDPRARWRGYHSYEERPFALDPAQGWLATTNDQVVGPQARYTIPGFYNVTRKTRIAAILEGALAAGKVDPAAMTRAQRDLVSGNAVRYQALAAAAADSVGGHEVAMALRAWNGRLGAGDSIATLWAYWWERLPREVFEDELGAEWRNARALIVAALEDSAQAFADDIRTPARESREMIAVRAMRFALAQQWRRPLGEAQTLTVRHPLAIVGPLDRWLHLTRGPIPIGGDDATLDAAFTSYDSLSGSWHDEAGPSMRFVMDWSDPDAFTLSRHLGQSGNPLSAHFDDFLQPHLSGEPWPIPFTRAKVQARAASTLRMVPAAVP